MTTAAVGAARLLRPEAVREISAGLALLDLHELRARFDPAASHVISPAARTYLTQALDVLQQNSLDTGSVDWPKARAAAFRMADGPAIRTKPIQRSSGRLRSCTTPAPDSSAPPQPPKCWTGPCPRTAPLPDGYCRTATHYSRFPPQTAATRRTYETVPGSCATWIDPGLRVARRRCPPCALRRIGHRESFRLRGAPVLFKRIQIAASLRSSDAASTHRAVATRSAAPPRPAIPHSRHLS